MSGRFRVMGGCVLVAAVAALLILGGAGSDDGAASIDVADVVDVSEVDDAVSYVSSLASGADVEESTVAGSMEEVVASTLEGYGEQAFVAASGYLGLTASAWGCVVDCGGTAYVLVVRESEEGGSCDVQTLRLDAETVSGS